jgi:hypothetical protein
MPGGETMEIRRACRLSRTAATRYTADRTDSGTKETARMGWSESYWDDVRGDLERLRVEAEPSAEDGLPGCAAAAAAAGQGLPGATGVGQDSVLEGSGVATDRGEGL